MPSVPITIRVCVGLAALAATLADSCLRGAAQEIAPVQQSSDSPPIPGLAPVDGFQPFTSADALAAYNRANGLAHKGDNVAARRQYDEAIELEPDSFDAHFNRAAIFIKLREWDRALDDYRDAIRLRPDDAITYNNGGVAYRGKGDHDLAMAHYGKALSLNPPGWTRLTIEANLKQYRITGNALAPSMEGAEFGLRSPWSPFAPTFPIARFPPVLISTASVAVTQRDI